MHVHGVGANHTRGMDPRADAVKLAGADSADLLDFLKALNGEGWQRYRAP